MNPDRIVTPLPLLLSLALAACGGTGAGRTGIDDAVPESPTDTAARPDAIAAADAEAGGELFAQTCAACHGAEGRGVEGLGKDMTASPFIAERDDAALVAFLKVGRLPDDPLNTTGVAMPPKGGNPALSDEQLHDIVAYVRSLQR